MTSSGKLGGVSKAVLIGLLAVALSAAVAGIAAAEDSQPAPVNPGPAANAAQQTTGNPAPAGDSSFPAQPPAAQSPDFVHQLKIWWNQGVEHLNAQMKDAQKKFEDLNKTPAEATKDAASAAETAVKNAATATKDAATAVVKLPSSRVIELSQICATAGNGAPDCQSAANSACQSKGFGSGRPLDVRTAEKCNASLWMSGQAPPQGGCPVETVLLRAFCQ